MNSDIERLAKEARYAWLRSQWIWHKRRISGADGRWHWRQARFYRKEAYRVFTLSEIVQRALSKYSSSFAENVATNNALFRRLAERSLSPMPKGEA